MGLPAAGVATKGLVLKSANFDAARAQRCDRPMQKLRVKPAKLPAMGCVDSISTPASYTSRG